MNNLTRTDALAVPCPGCTAKEGEPCLGDGGRVRTGCHSERYRAAASAPPAPVREHRSYDDEPARDPRPTWCQCIRVDAIVHLCDEHRRIGLEAIAAIKARRIA